MRSAPRGPLKAPSSAPTRGSPIPVAAARFTAASTAPPLGAAAQPAARGALLASEARALVHADQLAQRDDATKSAHLVAVDLRSSPPTAATPPPSSAPRGPPGRRPRPRRARACNLAREILGCS